MHNFKKLVIWTKSVEFVTEIYKTTSTFPENERFGLVSQLQRAAVSVPTNIAEGSAKSSTKDFARFLEISLGSTFELETELFVSLNLSYVNLEQYNQLINKLTELQKMILGFKEKLQSENQEPRIKT
ncbi:four helix bundle protein [Microbacter margulisiae]|uniref:Four helix bundle protein n=1 Tax=Microbacter margulisiae TaxID=1350067 RepID=A0A7W5DQ78_9PORP|nr:four helix bundle protein [Microbacter margulisiae]MBB3186946.1 four helix bundle protein [Microbacter margulisiae]